MEQQEKKLFQTLQKVGIDVKKDLAVRNMAGNRYKLKSGAMKLRKEYVLLLHDVNTLDRVFAGLEQMGGVEAEVERVDHSQIEKLRREVKEDADKGGKGKSNGLSRGDRSEYKRGYLYQGRALGRDGCPIYVERGS